MRKNYIRLVTIQDIYLKYISLQIVNINMYLKDAPSEINIPRLKPSKAVKTLNLLIYCGIELLSL